MTLDGLLYGIAAILFWVGFATVIGWLGEKLLHRYRPDSWPYHMGHRR